MAWDQIAELRARSSSQMDARKNDLGFSISLAKREYKLGEEPQIITTLSNRTFTNLVVYRLDAMEAFGCPSTMPTRIELVLTLVQTQQRVEGKCELGFPQVGFAPPQSFSVLTWKNSDSLVITLGSVFSSIQPGSYTLQVLYVNEGSFGAVVTAEPQSYFVDYDAWLGTASSNIESFQINP